MGCLFGLAYLYLGHMLLKWRLVVHDVNITASPSVCNANATVTIWKCLPYDVHISLTARQFAAGYLSYRQVYGYLKENY